MRNDVVGSPDPAKAVATEPSPAPEVYVDAIDGISAANGIVKLNFVSFVYDHATKTVQKRVVLRVVASAANLMDISQLVTKTLVDLAKPEGEAP